jgi:hypothetical protein
MVRQDECEGNAKVVQATISGTNEFQALVSTTAYGHNVQHEYLGLLHNNLRAVSGAQTAISS